MSRPTDLLTKRDVADLLSVSEKTVERCINATEPEPGSIVRPFPGWKLLGRKKVITRAAYEAWLTDLPDA